MAGLQALCCGVAAGRLEVKKSSEREKIVNGILKNSDGI
jgi:hypothetical protein